MNLTEFTTELQSNGFDGFQLTDLERYVNWGYRYVANRFPWYWERTTASFTVTPGSASVPNSMLPNFRSLDRLYTTTADQRIKMLPATDDDFFTKWLPLDLTAIGSRGEPRWYYEYEDKIYLLPPPQATRTYIAHYHQRVVLLDSSNPTPLTPDHLDEAIYLAAKVRCHRRASEPSLLAEAKIELEDLLGNMYTDEEFLMAEQPDRVSPDDTWL